MSKRDDMINTLCPDGVEYVKLGDVCEIKTGKGITQKDCSEIGDYPVYSGGKEPIGFYSKMNRDANIVMIINVGASAGTIGYSEKEFWPSDGCYCLSHTDKVLSRYLYFVLSKDQHYFQGKVRHGGIPTLDALVVKNYSSTSIKRTRKNSKHSRPFRISHHLIAARLASRDCGTPSAIRILQRQVA